MPPTNERMTTHGSRMTATACLAVGAAFATSAGCGERPAARGLPDLRPLRAVASQRADGALLRLHTRPDLRPPRVVVTRASALAAPGDVLITPTAPIDERSGPIILDRLGRMVWFHPLPRHQRAVNLQVQRYRGQPVLTWGQRRFHSVDSIYGGSARTKFNVIVNRRYRVIARVRARGAGVDTDLHDFVITPRGTALVMGYRLASHNLARVGGSRRGRVIEGVVQEVSIRTGRVLFDWRSLDHIALPESYARPRRGAAYDYIHLNSIALDRDGNLLLSARHTSAVYKVSRRTGRVIWRLSGKRSSYRMGRLARFFYQHDARRLPDGTLSVFDNHWAYGNVRRARSRAITLWLDVRRRTARLARSFVHPVAPRLATSQGNFQLLADGHPLVGWGSVPAVSELDASGRSLFEAHLDSQTHQSYRAYKFPWPGRPGGRPVARAVIAAPGVVVLYASWNGAGDIAAWEILAGPSRRSLRPIGLAPWRGLETAVTVGGRHPYLAVRALDAQGRGDRSSPAVGTRPAAARLGPPVRGGGRRHG
jgi:hypothetical protein